MDPSTSGAESEYLRSLGSHGSFRSEQRSPRWTERNPPVFTERDVEMGVQCADTSTVASKSAPFDPSNPSKVETGSGTPSVYDSSDEEIEQEEGQSLDNELFLSLLEMSSDGLIVIDSTGIVTRFGLGVEKMFRYSSHEVVGKSVKILMPRKYADEHDEYMERYQRSGIKHVIGMTREVEGRRKDGHAFPLSLHVCESRCGDATLYTGYLTDMGRSVADRNDLNYSTQSISLIMNSVEEAIIIADWTGMITEFNNIAEHMFQLKAREMQGSNVRKLMPEPHSSRHDKYIARYLRSDNGRRIGNGKDIESVGRRRDGSHIQVRIRLAESTVGGKHFFTAAIKDSSEERKDEEELNNKSQWLTTITDSLSDSLVTINMDGIIESANEGTSRIFGLNSPKAILGNNVNVLMPSPYKEYHDGYIKAYIRCGVRKAIGKGREVSGMRANGEVFPLHIMVNEMRVNQRTMFTAHMRDITKEKEALQTLRSSESKMLGVVESMNDALININQVGVIETFNPAAEVMFGHGASAVIGRNVKMLMAEPYASEHDDYLETYVRTGRKKIIGLTVARELEGKRANGSTFYIQITVSESVVGASRIFTAIIRDNSVRKLRESELRKAEERTRSILEAAVDAVVVIDTRGTMQFFNRAAVKMFIIQESEALGKNVKVLMPSPFQEEHDSYLSNYLNTGISTLLRQSREVVAQRSDGSVFPAEILVWDAHVGSKLVFTGILRDISQIKQSMEQTREAEEKVMTIMQSEMDAMIVTDEVGDIEMFNQAAERLLQYTKEDIQGQNVRILMPEPYSTDHDSYILNYRETGTRKMYKGRELLAKRKDGSVCTIDISLNVVLLGKTRIFTGILRDSSLRKKLEGNLRKKEEVLKDLLEQSIDGVVVIDSKGIIIYFNPAADKLFGYASKEALGKNVEMLMPEPYNSTHQSYIDRYVATKEKRVIGKMSKLLAVTKTGATLHVQLTVSETVVDGQHQFTATIRDITDRMEIELRVKASEEMVAQLVNNAVDGFIVMDEKCVVHQFNPTACRMFGFNADEIIGHDVKFLMPAPYRHEHGEYVDSYLRTGVKKVIGSRRRVKGRKKDGTVFYVELCVYEMLLHKDSSRMFAAIVQDITNRQFEEVNFEMLQRMTDTYLAFSPDSVCIIDARGGVVRANTALLALFEYQESAVVGHNVKMLMPNPYCDEHDTYLLKYKGAARSKTINKWRTTVGKKHDHALIPIELRVTEVWAGSRLYFCGVIRAVGEGGPGVGRSSPFESGPSRSPVLGSGASPGYFGRDLDKEKSRSPLPWDDASQHTMAQRPLGAMDVTSPGSTLGSISQRPAKESRRGSNGGASSRLNTNRRDRKPKREQRGGHQHLRQPEFEEHSNQHSRTDLTTTVPNDDLPEVVRRYDVSMSHEAPAGVEHRFRNKRLTEQVSPDQRFRLEPMQTPSRHR